MPSPQDYATRREAYAAWLTANAIAPRIVLVDADVTIVTKDDGSRVIAYEGCDLDAEGRKQIDERGMRVATRRFETPLIVEPPDWWEPYEKPTRDQLLEGVKRVHSLHVRNENSGVCEHCSERDYPNYEVPWPCATVQALIGEARP